MQNTFTPASFLATALAKERNVLKTDNEVFIIREEDATVASRLYKLFFNEKRSTVKPAFYDNAIPDTDYYSSYE
ncbi:MAG TPA: hypothetical protein VL946_03420 [Lacibacter sp.]|jgi:hypothetical protein|nr:hypothetical protein [Lacibacter sp.]